MDTIAGIVVRAFQYDRPSRRSRSSSRVRWRDGWGSVALVATTLGVATLGCGGDVRDTGLSGGFGSGVGPSTPEDSTSGADDASAADETGPKLDVNMDDTEGAACPEGSAGGGQEGDYEFSVIWIANSGQGTVSKIDTITATELARYYTGPPEDGDYVLHDPSRTSVNLRGDVVVANRSTWGEASSFTKITGEAEICPDRNGDGEIRTSQGPNDVLPWGEDDCVEWNYVVPSNNARAVAWDAGLDECGFIDKPNVWVGYRHTDGFVRIDLVDGDQGTLIEQVVIDDPTYPADGYGIYGGAADGDGNFWGNNNGVAIFVDRETFQWSLHDGGGYGFALDEEGNPWGSWGSGRVAQTDIDAGYEVDVFVGAAGGYDRGIAIDQDQYLWLVTNDPCGIARFDLATLTWVDPHLPWDGCMEPVGVSIDAEGHVWVVDREANRALKMRPNEPGLGVEILAEVTGLVDPYTYSDMTGAALNLVVNPPEG